MAGCGGAPARPQWRTALRFENLTGDASLDWAARGAAEIAARRLLAAARTGSQVSAPAQRTEAILSGAAEIVSGSLIRAGDRLRVEIWIEDAATGRIRHTSQDASGAAGGVLPGAAEAFPGAGPRALREYFLGLEAGGLPTAAAALARATEIEPALGPAWVARADMELRRDRAAARRVLDQARAHSASFAPADKANLDLVAAELEGDSRAGLRALQTLSRHAAPSPGLFRGLGDLAMRAREPVMAAEAYSRAAELDPQEPRFRNAIGYARAAAGDLEGALRAMREYQAIRPDDANPFDSSGEIYFRFGKFPEAGQAFLEARRRDSGPSSWDSLGKAAFARLLSGDRAGADRIFSQLMEAAIAAREPGAEFRLANWQFLSGRRKEGRARLEKFASAAESGPTRELGSLAHAHLTVWNLLLGRSPEAAASARHAARLAHTPASQNLARLCASLAGLPGEPPSGYSMLLRGRFADAEAVWRKVHARAPVSPAEDSGVLLAWALTAGGHGGKDAAALLEGFPIPRVSQPQPMQAFTFPRILYLRARAAEQTGQREQADREFRLFLDISGDEPFALGEEQDARRRLSGR